MPPGFARGCQTRRAASSGRSTKSPRPKRRPRSSTQTLRPAPASRHAAIPPPNPDPTTIASYRCRTARHYGDGAGVSVPQDGGHRQMVARPLARLAVEGAGPARGLGGDRPGVVDPHAVDVEPQALRVEQSAGGDHLVEHLVAVGEHLLLRCVDEVGAGVLLGEEPPARVEEEAVVAAVVDRL